MEPIIFKQEKMDKTVIKSTNKNKKQASSVIFLTVFFVMFLAFSTLAVDGTIVLTNRAKLQNITEMTALAAASEFNYLQSASSTAIADHVSNTAETTFELLKQEGLKNAELKGVNPIVTSNRVIITSEMVSQPYFLAFLGVSGITLEAKACAVSEPLPIEASHAGISWLTPKAAYLSDILSNSDATPPKTPSLNDTAILPPLGNLPASSYVSGIANFSLLNDGDEGKALSLGPGGFVTIRLPAPIVDKTGYDLYIKEVGTVGDSGKTKEGYIVYAGIDKNPDNPYVRKDEEGEKISWVNISTCGDSEDSSFTSAHHYVKTQLSSSTDDFYGSGYFDLGKCGIYMAKYLRIIDDNNESAFVTNNGTTYYKAMMYGEASTATAGADIDKIVVLNHVRLIPSTN